METRQTRHLVAPSSSSSKSASNKKRTSTIAINLHQLKSTSPIRAKRGRPRINKNATDVKGNSQNNKNNNHNKNTNKTHKSHSRRRQNGTSTPNEHDSARLTNGASGCANSISESSNSCADSEHSTSSSVSNRSSFSSSSAASSGSDGGSVSSNEGSSTTDSSPNLARSNAKKPRSLNDRRSSQTVKKLSNQHDFSVFNGTTSTFNSIHKRKQHLVKTKNRKRHVSSSDESSPPKKQRSSAIAAKLKITQSPTANKASKTNSNNNNSLAQLKHQHAPIENAATQTVRSHPNNHSARNRRSRSISSSCSRRSPLLNGCDYNENQSEGEEQTIRLRCPVEGCNSEGHSSGRFESHFTQTTCPVFHNLTPKECIERYLNRQRGRRVDLEYVRSADLSRPSTPSSIIFRGNVDTTPIKGANRKPSQSPKNSPKSKTNTPIKIEKPDCDKSLLNRLVEHRKREINQIILQNSTPQKKPEIVRNPSREPNLKNLTPIFDYEMFKEAQAKASEQLQEKARDVKMRYGIKCIDLGRYEIDVWYGSPYPEEYRYLPKLFICEFCLKYMTSAAVSSRHVQKCSLRHPPGNEIYRKGNISFFEVDGQQNEIYCQNLCLLAKLFLDHKTLYFDVAPFLFYVMTEYDEDGFHILGYFSKEKNSFLNYNVSCILTLPPYQKQGYGKLLIDLSYLMTRLEGKVGSPEKPLSDMGLISYRSYWKLIILEYLCNYQAKEISIKDISQETGVNAYDIISTLQAMGMLKYWKGRHLILTRQDILDDYRVNRRKKDSFKRIDPSCLKWTPPANSN